MSQRTIHDDTSPLPPPPAGSSLNLNLSSKSNPNSKSSTPSVLSGSLPLPPKKAHRTWHAIYIHSAKCDGCHTKKHKALQRCDGCTLQYCRTCMPKAAENSHEYDESKLDWDPNQKSPTFRDRSSMKKKREKGEKLPPKSRLGGFVVGDEEVEYEEDPSVETRSERCEKSGSSVRSSARGGAGSRRGSYRGAARPTERLLTEAEKYHPQVRLLPSLSDDLNSDDVQGYGASYAGGVNGPEYGRYANQDMLIGADDGYSTALRPTKRQRKDGPNLERSMASQSFEHQRFNNEIFDSRRIGRIQASSSSIMTRPINKVRPAARQQHASMASVASSRREPGYYHPQQEQNPPQIGRSTARRAASMLTLDSTFEEATDAVMKAQEDEENLPRRRKEFEEYCKDRWQNEPILKQLRNAGQDGEAEELWLASKAALFVAYRLGDEFGPIDG
ncbi:hypothetical protein BKA64DRAFT_656818 [Cadophora sp. MPI-SDFR-AT-0126]|nr:hypothetical protein BKA64DRAFT_656818 [Leotiomycetes sp. MPI-SDFR-AT-0126]